MRDSFQIESTPVSTLFPKNDKTPKRISAKVSLRPDFISWRVSRDLLLNLIYLDLTPKYQKIWKGCTWAILQPLLISLVASFSLKYKISGSQSSFDYLLSSLSALVPWYFFSNGFVKAVFSISHRKEWIKKVYAPQIILVVASATSGLVDLLVSSVFLFLCSWFLKGHYATQLYLIPLYSIVAWLLLIAIGLLLSPLIAINNDIRFAAPFILQLYFFSTPILYKIENLPPFIQKLELFNPMALVVNGFQSVFSGGETITTSCVLAGTLTTGVVFFFGFLFFQSKVRNLAELL